MKQGFKNHLKESQLQGAVLVALSALIIPAVLCFYRGYFFPVPDISLRNPCPGCIAVEVEGNAKEKGIYFIPKGWRVADLLAVLGLSPDSQQGESSGSDLSTPLYDGIKISLPPGKDERSRIETGGMAAAKRLALSRPIDLNRATLEELILVPGIGEKTALKICEARKREGKFRELEDLMKIKGIKEKRLAKLKPYLYVDHP